VCDCHQLSLLHSQSSQLLTAFNAETAHIRQLIDVLCGSIAILSIIRSVLKMRRYLELSSYRRGSQRSGRDIGSYVGIL
jgi:hypothetical protein